MMFLAYVGYWLPWFILHLFVMWGIVPGIGVLVGDGIESFKEYLSLVWKSHWVTGMLCAISFAVFGLIILICKYWEWSKTFLNAT